MVKIVISDKYMKEYVTGVFFAGYYFIQTNPDWSDRLIDLTVYSVGWPINFVREVSNAVNALL